jgi:hypothetical protein
MVNRSSSVDFVFTPVIFCCLFQPLLSLSFELFNDVLLLRAQVGRLCFELLHTFIDCPGSFEITGCHLALSLPLFLELPSPLFSRFLFLRSLITNVKSCCSVSGVLGKTLTLETVVLIHKLASVYMLRL